MKIELLIDDKSKYFMLDTNHTSPKQQRIHHITKEYTRKQQQDFAG